MVDNVRKILISTFEEIFRWFDKEAALRAYKPVNEGWSINEIPEHVTLTNHYLLILIEKGKNKALQKAQHLDLETELDKYKFQTEKLAAIGQYRSFEWHRPDHMEPTGNKILSQVKATLSNQLDQCLQVLEALKNGEGILHKTTMTVYNLGKLDVYEYLYFLAQHAQRHIKQMERNEQEYLKEKK